MTPKTPLAERLRPKTVGEFLGQRYLIGEGTPLSELLAHDALPSLIFWGPPGSGKTTLARIIAHQTKAKFHPMSAVLAGIQDLQTIIERGLKKLDRTIANDALQFVIQTAASWDRQSAGQEEKNLRSILFDAPPIGAKFKMPKP